MTHDTFRFSAHMLKNDTSPKMFESESSVSPAATDSDDNDLVST